MQSVTRPRPISVFAVEDRSLQVVWRAGVLRPGRHTVSAGRGVSAPFDSDAGPGSVVLEGLLPATAYEVAVDGRTVATVRTLASPPGELLARFATVSDLHIGEDTVGPLKRIHEGPLETADTREDGGTAYTVRALRSAVDELVAWGADAILVKGDITDEGHVQEIEVAGRELTRPGLPLIATRGNHDVKLLPDYTPFGLPAVGLPVAERGEILTLDLPGIRLVAGDTTIDTRHGGRVRAATWHRICDAVADAPAAFIGLHHHFRPPQEKLVWPPGIPGARASRLFAELRHANERVLVSSGHSHRNRRSTRSGIAHTEVGSTKDFPGVWAGYAVHEGGIRQVVRRIAAPDVLAWTDRTARAAAGVWAVWAPGSLEARCFSLAW